MSKDGTLWLDHSNEVFNCNEEVVGCFQELTDEEINAERECNGVIKYYTLESVFVLMAEQYKESYISLDVKWQYCDILSTTSVMRDMANAILVLVSKYDMQGRVLVESNSLAFLDELDSQDLVVQFVVSLGDVDRGIADAGATKSRGISLKYGIEEVNAEVVDLIHKKGYGLILWVVNEPEDIVSAWNSYPDFIQTDNSEFKSYIPITTY